MLNVVTIVGRLVGEPEIRATKNGKHVTNLCVAVERDFKTDGKKSADFLDVTAWGGLADFINNYFSKGDMIAVTGRMTMNIWEDKDGGKRKSVYILASSAYFASSIGHGGFNKSTDADDENPQFPEITDDDPDLPVF